MSLFEWLILANSLVGATALVLQLGVPGNLVRKWRLLPALESVLWLMCAVACVLVERNSGVALLGFMLVHGITYVLRLMKGLWHWQRTIPSPLAAQRTQLMDVRGQLARIHEQERLNASIKRTQEEKRMFVSSMHRFEAILVTIEAHLAFGKSEQAEHLITAFGKHLRGILNEASSPFIRLKDSLDAARNYLSLMEALTDERLMVDLDDGEIPDAHLVRMTANFEITPWIEEATWSLFEAAEQNTSVSASHTILVRLNDNEITLQLDQLSGRSVKLLGSGDPLEGDQD